MNAHNDERCFMVSLYGTALDSGDLVPLMGDVIEFFHAAGRPPSHLSVTGRGFGDKPLQFKRAWKRIQKAVVGDVLDVSMVSFNEGGDDHTIHWAVSCDIVSEPACFQLGAGLHTMPDAGPQIVAFIRRALSKLRPAYGIGFYRERSRGPTYYGIGLGFGRTAFSGPEYEESLATSRWGYEGRTEAVYDHGILRDIYPYNLLSARYLERDVGGLSFGDWIRAEPMRGRLQAWTDEHALWTPAADHIDEIRGQLAHSGMLFK